MAEPGDHHDDDALGVFVPHGRIALEGAARGPLTGASFAVKDIFDVAGCVTGCGNPDWLASHDAATAHAPPVRAWLDAGARLVGKTVTEELAFSIVGINPYYGAPVNRAAPGRVAGGSSSGSAAAVGGGVVDLAIGSDTGGSVRVPASYNGILGLRPTHGRISLAGAMPLAPSFDTVGWFARDPELLAAAGRVLLADQAPGRVPRRLLVASDALARTEAGVADALAPAIARVEAVLGLGPATPIEVAGGQLDDWYACFRTLQAAEAWASHGPWIEQARPQLGPLLRIRLELAASITAEAARAAAATRQTICARLDHLLGDDALLILPSAGGPAPPLDAPVTVQEAVRDRTVGITCIASLGGLPQLSLPLSRVAAGPIGLSLIAPRGQDATLLDLAVGLGGGPAAV